MIVYIMLSTDQFRVITSIGNGPMADYILKVYDNKIKLYTSNGILSTDFSCDLKEIYRIKCLPGKNCKSPIGYLSITIKNAKSKYAIASGQLLAACVYVRICITL